MLGPETLEIEARIEKGGNLYYQAVPRLIFNQENNIIAANFLAKKLVENVTVNSPNIFATLASTAFKNKTTSKIVKVSDIGKGIILEFISTFLDSGRHVYLTQTNTWPCTNFLNTLVESYERLESLAKNSNNFMWETDSNGIFSFISGSNNFHYDLNEIFGKQSHELLAPETNDNIENPFMTKTFINEMEVKLIQSDGTTGILVTSAIPLWSKNNKWCGARGIGRDVTIDRQRDIELSAAKNRERILQYIMDKIREPDTSLNSLESATQAIITTLAVEGCQILKFDKSGHQQKIIGSSNLPFSITKQLKQGIDKDSPTIFNVSIYRFAVHVTKYQNETNGVLIFWGEGESTEWDGEDLALFEQTAHLIGVELQHLHTQERLEKLSTTDPLTGLLNRRTFSEILETKFSTQSENQTPHGVLVFIDIDNFKLINDHMGHHAGDKALIKISSKLQELANENDLVARLGGDEFAIWFDRKESKDAELIMKTITKDSYLLSKFSIDKSRPFGISFGLETYDGKNHATLTQLIGKADASMYREKRKTRIDKARE